MTQKTSGPYNLVYGPGRELTIIFAAVTRNGERNTVQWKSEGVEFQSFLMQAITTIHEWRDVKGPKVGNLPSLLSVHCYDDDWRLGAKEIFRPNLSRHIQFHMTFTLYGLIVRSNLPSADGDAHTAP